MEIDLASCYFGGCWTHLIFASPSSDLLEVITNAYPVIFSSCCVLATGCEVLAVDLSIVTAKHSWLWEIANEVVSKFTRLAIQTWTWWKTWVLPDHPCHMCKWQEIVTEETLGFQLFNQLICPPHPPVWRAVKEISRRLSQIEWLWWQSVPKWTRKRQPGETRNVSLTVQFTLHIV